MAKRRILRRSEGKVIISCTNCPHRKHNQSKDGIYISCLKENKKIADFRFYGCYLPISSTGIFPIPDWCPLDVVPKEEANVIYRGKTMYDIFFENE